MCDRLAILFNRPLNFFYSRIDFVILFIVPSAPPDNVQTGMLNLTAGWVRWSPPPPQHHNGLLLGYKIQVQFIIGFVATHTHERHCPSLSHKFIDLFIYWLRHCVAVSDRVEQWEECIAFSGTLECEMPDANQHFFSVAFIRVCLRESSF